MTAQNDNIKALVVSAEKKLREVAPQWLSVERLTRLALAARSRNPALAECTPDSFLLFCLRCAETGLEPIGAGGAWPVPFRNKNGTREVQFIPDWRGLIWLAKQGGQIKHAYGDIVKQNDIFEYEKGDMPRCVHKPALKDRGETIGAYCVVVLPDDTKHIEWMNVEELDGIRNRSKAKDSGPWVTDTEAMMIKTVVKRGLKPFAGSPQLHTAIEYDNSVIGLRQIEDRPPVAMPTAKAPQAEDNPPAANRKATSKPATDPQDSEQTVTGVIEDVKVAQSKPGAKKEWTRFGIIIDGISYGTFDTELGDLAVTMKGEEVTLTWKDDGTYKNAVRITLDEPKEQGQAPAEPTQDELDMGDADEDRGPFGQ